MNSMLRNYITVKGREAALKVASVLLEQDYQVMIQLDDCNIYIVAYEYNDPTYGDNQFASISPNEMEALQFKRDEAKYRESVDFVDLRKHEFETATEVGAANELDDHDESDCCSDFSEYHSIS